MFPNTIKIRTALALGYVGQVWFVSSTASLYTVEWVPRTRFATQRDADSNQNTYTGHLNGPKKACRRCFIFSRSASSGNAGTRNMTLVFIEIANR